MADVWIPDDETAIVKVEDIYADPQFKTGINFLLGLFANPGEKPLYFTTIGLTRIHWTRAYNNATRWRHRPLAEDYKRFILMDQKRRRPEGIILVGEIEEVIPLGEIIPAGAVAVSANKPLGNLWRIHYSGMTGERNDEPIRLIPQHKRLYK